MRIAIIIWVNVLVLMVSNIAQGELTNKNQPNDYLKDQIVN